MPVRRWTKWKRQYWQFWQCQVRVKILFTSLYMDIASVFRKREQGKAVIVIIFRI
ncbi:hypothetical protein BX070DRAFT_220032 [Coemansia spiralis]|nr:hypothetical protein BX070DRAFT_220032 [Coemansia spiralis]